MPVSRPASSSATSLGLHDAFRARVMFPIRDAQGRVIAFGGRVLDARMPKYLNSPESPAYSKTRTLYGLHEARQAIASQDRVIIVEGYFDVIALWQAGFRETVASCGTSLTVEQLRLLSRYTKNVFACFDGDAAGRKASLRALEIFLQAGLLGRGIFIPTGFDPDTLVRERGAAFLEELIAASELLVDYFLKEQSREAKGSLPGRARAAEKVAELLKLVGNPFEFDLLARKAAEMLGVGEDTLRKAVRARRFAREARRASHRNRQRTAAPRCDHGGGTRLGRNRSVASLTARGNSRICSPDLFSDAALRRFSPRHARWARSKPVSTSSSASDLSEEQQARIAAIAVGALVDDPASARKLAEDYSFALSRRQTRREVDELKRAANSPSDPGSSEGDAVASVQALIELKKRKRSNAS